MADPSAQFRRLPSIAVIAQGPTHHTALPPQGAEPARRLSIKTCRNRGAFAPDVAITCGARGAESASRNGPCFCPLNSPEDGGVRSQASKARVATDDPWHGCANARSDY